VPEPGTFFNANVFVGGGRKDAGGRLQCF